LLMTMYIGFSKWRTSSQAVSIPVLRILTPLGWSSTFVLVLLDDLVEVGWTVDSQNFIFPLLILGGTSLSITTAFVDPSTGDPIGTTFAYDFAVNISQAYPHIIWSCDGPV